MELVTLSEEEIDRAMFEPLRRAVVALGYMPDIRSFPNNEVGYKAARETLRTAKVAVKETLIEVFGVGAWQARDEATDSRIVINREAEGEGTIGSSGIRYLEKVVDDGVNSKFDKKQMPDQTSNLIYAFRTVTTKTKMDRLMASIVKTNIRKKGYMRTVDDYGNYTDKGFLVEYMGTTEMSLKEYTERKIRFRVIDVYLEPPAIVQTNIPVMTTIEGGIYLLPEEEGEQPITTFPLNS